MGKLVVWRRANHSRVKHDAAAHPERGVIPNSPAAEVARRYSASALIGRLMSERTASLALRCRYNTR